MAKKWEKQRNILLNLKKEILKTEFEDVNWPDDNKTEIQNYIWVGFHNKLIGNDNCHYEFIFQPEEPDKLSLEVHLDELDNQKIFANILIPDFLCFKNWNHRKGRIIFKTEYINIDDENIYSKCLKLLDRLHNSIGNQLIQIIETHSELLPEHNLIPRLVNKSRKIVVTKKYKERAPQDAYMFNTRHGEIQSRLEQILTRSKKYKYITLESGFENLNYQIDLLAQKENGHYDIFEVKPHATALECIREALGQILHYKFLLEKGNYYVDELYIIGPSKITDEELLYLNTIQKLNSSIKYMDISI